MKKLIPLVFLFAASGAWANAGLVTCTGAMVSAGYCASTAESLLYVSHLRLDPDGSGPATGWDEIAASICAKTNYQAVIADPQNPGLTNPNPQTCAQHALAQVRDWLRSAVREHRVATDAAAQPSRVQPPPEVGQ